MWPPNVPSKATFSFVHLLQALQLSSASDWSFVADEDNLAMSGTILFCLVVSSLSPVSPRRRFFLPRVVSSVLGLSALFQFSHLEIKINCLWWKNDKMR